MEIVISGVYAGYGDSLVLNNLSMKVGDGEILGVLGRNGMGKSTLVRTIAGLNLPTAGKILAGGQDITLLPPHQRARIGISTIVQGRGIFPQLTVSENLEMGRMCAERDKSSRLDEVLSYFPKISERLDQKAGTMSGGEQQMLAISRGLMTHPKVILLDEPSDGIMPTLVNKIAEILIQINREHNLTIIIVEQNVPMVFRMTEQCLIIENGSVVAQGARADLEGSDAMREYLAI